MRVLAFFLAVIIGVVPFLETRDLHAASEAEDAAARIPLENYINAHATGNPDYIRKAFLPSAKIMAFRDGKLLNLSVEEFASRFSGKPAADESQRKRRIDSLNITGNAGVARIVCLWQLLALWRTNRFVANESPRIRFQCQLGEISG